MLQQIEPYCTKLLFISIRFIFKPCNWILSLYIIFVYKERGDQWKIMPCLIMNQCDAAHLSFKRQRGNPICRRCVVTAFVGKVSGDWQHGNNTETKPNSDFFLPCATDDCRVRLLLYSPLVSLSGACRSQLTCCVMPAEMIGRIYQLQR